MKQINYIGNKSSINLKKITIKKSMAKCDESKGCAR